MAGCVLTGVALSWRGSRTVILTVTGCAVAVAAVLAAAPVSVSDETALMALLFVLGFFLLGAQGSLYALATHVYPAAIRSTGLGAAAGFGGAGAIIIAYVGAAALGVGSGVFFGIIAACLLVAFAAVAAVNPHSGQRV